MTESLSSSLATKSALGVSFVVSAAFSVIYGFGRSSGYHHGHKNLAGNTPFTANILLIFVFWLITYLWQAAYLVQFFQTNERRDIAWHFTFFNLAQWVWAFLFVRGHYLLSFIVVIVNILNLLTLYITHKPYSITPLSKWLLIHIPTTALPLAWTFYQFFWTGAVLFRGTGAIAKIISLILIWDFLIIPALFVILFRDWATGVAFAYLTIALGVGQFFVKVLNLQWIFAFIIGPLVLVLSLIVALVPRFSATVVEEVSDETPNEQAPLLNGQQV